MWIFTSCNDGFAPGVRALAASIRANFPEANLCVLAYGDDVDFDADRVIVNADLPVRGDVIRQGQTFRSGIKYSEGYAHSAAGPELYARLLVPEFTDAERALYVDADCLVLDDLSELWRIELDGMPTACVSRSTIGWPSDPRKRWQDMASGVFLIDCVAWRNLDLSGAHFWTDPKGLPPPQPQPDPKEGLMGHVHDGAYVELAEHYQNLAYWGNLTSRDKVVHYADDKPWLPPIMHGWVNYAALWQAYADGDEDRASEIQSALPHERIHGYERRRAR